jgi:hypothetical protein
VEWHFNFFVGKKKKKKKEKKEADNGVDKSQLSGTIPRNPSKNSAGRNTGGSGVA